METTIKKRPDRRPAPRDGFPFVVITLPFDPSRDPMARLEASLKAALAQAESQLLSIYDKHVVQPFISNLHLHIQSLNFDTDKKSLVLLASSQKVKTLYLDFPVETEVLVDQDFHFRNLAISMDTHAPYLVLLLSSQNSKMFHYDGTNLQLLKSNPFPPVYAYTHQLPEKVANFSDPAAMKEQLLDKFLHHLDEGLTTILEAYPLPVFVVGTDKVLGHFSRITHNGRQIAFYIHKNGMNAASEELKEILRPYQDGLGTIRRQLTLKHLELAIEKGKLTSGLDAVGKSVDDRNGRLLILERNFTGEGALFNGSYVVKPPTATAAYPIADSVDLIIEKVLEFGGKVEWVDEGQLEDHGHIALVRYY